MFFRWKGRRGSIEGRTLTFQSCLLLWIQKREDLELVLVLVCCLDLTRQVVLGALVRGRSSSAALNAPFEKGFTHLAGFQHLPMPAVHSYEGQCGR